MESLDPLVPLDTSKQLTIESLQQFRPGKIVQSSNLKDFIVGNYKLDVDGNYTFDGKELEMIKKFVGLKPLDLTDNAISNFVGTGWRKPINRSYDECINTPGANRTKCYNSKLSAETSEYKSAIKNGRPQKATKIKKDIRVFNEFVNFLDELGYFRPDRANYTYKVISSPDELVKLTGSRTLYVTSEVHTGKLFIIFDEKNDVSIVFVIYEDKDGEEIKKKRVFIEVIFKDEITNALKKTPMNGGRRFSRKYKKLNKRIKSSKRSYRKPKSRRTRRQRK